jgi:protease I|tara:strand:+ start:283 stop:810 length:528 start_codon:yes stop_codon:yes gene_type:complete
MKRALILTQRNVQEHEFFYPYYRLREEGFEVTVATEDGQETTGILGLKIPVDSRIDSINPDNYSLLVLPGGAKAMEYLRQNEMALNMIREWNQKGKVIASICHAAQLLISADSVRGKRISGYYSIKDDINNSGAIYVDAPFVTDGNIISSPHYKYLGPWMKESLRVFYEKNDTVY